MAIPDDTKTRLIYCDNVGVYRYDFQIKIFHRNVLFCEGQSTEDR